MWSDIKDNLLQILNKSVPSKLTSSRYFPPWITTQTKRYIRNKQIWYRRAKKSNDPKTWQKYQDYKKLAQKFCRRSHDSYVEDLLTTGRDNLGHINKKFWTYIKSQRNERSGIADLFVNGKWISDTTQKANSFNAQFSKVFSTPGTPFRPPPAEPHGSAAHINNISINRTGILKLLLGIKENKAPGPDGLPGKLLKMCAEELCGVLTVLFQKSLDSGTVPSDWKVAHITPVYKKSDKSCPSNYRPISLTSIVCKLMEHVVYSSVINFLDDNDILSDFQHGFRQRRSCETQLINTLRDFSNCLDKSSQVDAILLDFSKAFDKVDHSTLLLKMSDYGI